jgi:putative sigma-54 modulation protein
MQVTISSQHVAITNTLSEYVRQKLTRVDRCFSPVIRSHVVLHVKRNRHQVGATVHTKGTQWHSTPDDKEMYVAIDRVVDKLNRQAIKHKEKVVDHHQEEGGLKNRSNT